MQWDDELMAEEKQIVKKPATRRSGPKAKAGATTPSKRKVTTQRGVEPTQKTARVVRPMPRMLIRYRGEISPSLAKEFEYKNPMEIPRVTKVVLNMGLGESLTNGRALDTATEQMGMISGQKAVVTKARRSIAGFKVREGMSIGCRVTMRGRRMWEFLDRFITLALPRIRDFRGLSRQSFDGQGNYSLGIREQIIFPEIDYNNLDRIRGLQVTIGTSAKTDHEGLRLLELLGMPFVRPGQN